MRTGFVCYSTLSIYLKFQVLIPRLYSRAAFDQHFLTEPLASNTENFTETRQLLHQWWNALEAKRGCSGSCLLLTQARIRVIRLRLSQILTLLTRPSKRNQ